MRGKRESGTNKALGGERERTKGDGQSDQRILAPEGKKRGEEVRGKKAVRPVMSTDEPPNTNDLLWSVNEEA